MRDRCRLIIYPSETSYLTAAYLILRKDGSLLISLLAMMLSTGMPELQAEADLEYMRTQLQLDQSSEEQVLKFLSFIFLYSNFCNHVKGPQVLSEGVQLLPQEGLHSHHKLVDACYQSDVALVHRNLILKERNNEIICSYKYCVWPVFVISFPRDKRSGIVYFDFHSYF